MASEQMEKEFKTKKVRKLFATYMGVSIYAPAKVRTPEMSLGLFSKRLLTTKYVIGGNDIQFSIHTGIRKANFSLHKVITCTGAVLYCVTPFL